MRREDEEPWDKNKEKNCQRQRASVEPRQIAARDLNCQQRGNEEGLGGRMILPSETLIRRDLGGLRKKKNRRVWYFFFLCLVSARNTLAVGVGGAEDGGG